MKIKITDILIEDRQRTDFGNISALAFGIKKHGQIAPIVVASLDEDHVSGKFYRLIAGERRIRANLFNGTLEIPAILWEDVDELVQAEIELEENMNRKQLTWQEECDSTRKLDDIKRQKYGDSQSGDNYGQAWGLQDTATSLGCSLGMVSQDIQLSKDLEENPALKARVASLPKTAARKIVKQAKKKKLLELQIQNKELDLNPSIILGSCTDLIKELPDASVDLWITDPPFAVKNIVKAATQYGYNETKTNVGDEDVMRETYKILIPEVFRVLKPGAHVYMFYGSAWHTELIGLLRSNGFEMDDIPLIWDKARPSVMARDYHYISSYEPILFGMKPPRTRPLKKPVKNVLTFPSIAGQKRIHPLQRPEGLLNLFIENSSLPGETVLDTFAGSGSTIMAAAKLRRKGIGFEIDEGNFLNIQNWFREEKV
jgi:site-specific DNA-methyltransferase (adenine-specific)/modification methylase